MSKGYLEKIADAIDGGGEFGQNTPAEVGYLERIANYLEEHGVPSGGGGMRVINGTVGESGLVIEPGLKPKDLIGSVMKFNMTTPETLPSGMDIDDLDSDFVIITALGNNNTVTTIIFASALGDDVVLQKVYYHRSSGALTETIS